MSSVSLMTGRYFVLALLLTFGPGHASLQAQQSTSASFVLQQSTTNTGGGASTSASFRYTGSSGQESTVGASSAGVSYVVQSGFWSFVGSGLVPVVLAVDRNAVASDNVDLTWSGNNAPYSVYRSSNCGDVLSSLFDTTTSNGYADLPSLGASLECYNVLATAPGPAPAP